jgi:hypothetical protein
VFHHLCHDLEFHPSVWKQGWPIKCNANVDCSHCDVRVIMTVPRELPGYKLDLAGVQEVRWDKGGNAKRRGLYFF